jgi:hypothetical protein
MLSKKIATQMRGRSLSWEMFPFLFREFLDYKGVESKAHYRRKSGSSFNRLSRDTGRPAAFPRSPVSPAT